jgi:hypothetical protein
MSVATDRIEKRGQGLIPPTRDAARYDEMLRMMASGLPIMAIAAHLGLSRRRVHQLLRVKQPILRRGAQLAILKGFLENLVVAPIHVIGDSAGDPDPPEVSPD